MTKNDPWIAFAPNASGQDRPQAAAACAAVHRHLPVAGWGELAPLAPDGAWIELVQRAMREPRGRASWVRGWRERK